MPVMLPLVVVMLLLLSEQWLQAAWENLRRHCQCYMYEWDVHSTRQ